MNDARAVRPAPLSAEAIAMYRRIEVQRMDLARQHYGVDLGDGSAITTLCDSHEAMRAALVANTKDALSADDALDLTRFKWLAERIEEPPSCCGFAVWRCDTGLVLSIEVRGDSLREAIDKAIAMECEEDAR